MHVEWLYYHLGTAISQSLNYMLSTSLSAQLKTLKQQSLIKKLDFAQPPPSLLFSTTLSRTIDIDLLYTLAMIGYESLKA